MRADPFHLALATLRERLRTGVFPPGARLAATLIAEELGLSPTPVREALSRLAGESLVEDRRGQGFFVRALSGEDVADLYRLSLAMLLTANDPGRPGGRLPREPLGGETPAANPIDRIERLFGAWVEEAGSLVLRQSHQKLAVQLGPIRRMEPLLLTDLEAEAFGLEAVDADEAPRGQRLAALRRFHVRRVQLAERLAALAERRPRHQI